MWQEENPSIFQVIPVFTQIMEELKNFYAMAAVNGKETTVFHTPVKQDKKLLQIST